MQPSEKKHWVRVQSQVKALGDQFNQHQQARLVLTQKRGDENIKWTGVRIQHLMDVNEVLDVGYDVLLHPIIDDSQYLESI